MGRYLDMLRSTAPAAGSSQAAARDLGDKSAKREVRSLMSQPEPCATARSDPPEASTPPEPVLMPDGRSLWRFGANGMPLSATPQAMELIDEARRYGVVLVGDGPELIVVERWRSRLRPETRDALRHRAAEVIGAMRRERRARSNIPL
jgi:hypothetical protein